MKLKDRKGNISIIMVISMMIGILIIVAFLDILKQTYNLNEVQYNMDISGIAALRSGVDEQKLRVGEFSVDKSIVVRHYKSMIDEAIRDLPQIREHRFVRTQIEDYVETWGLGVTSKSRPQVLLDSTMVIVVDSSTVFDKTPGLEQRYYNSRTGQTFEVTYLGRTDDGLVELSVRSVSRIVYR